MVRLNWTDQAIKDLNKIAEYIAIDSQRYAKVQIKRIRTKAQTLTQFPMSGRIVPEINRDDVRELILGNYRIIYKKVSANRIDILTIHHGARLFFEENIG